MEVNFLATRFFRDFFAPSAPVQSIIDSFSSQISDKTVALVIRTGWDDWQQFLLPEDPDKFPLCLKGWRESGGLPSDINVFVTSDREDVKKATLAKLKSNGSKIFLDDFGSAYSNVEVLNSYDFDGLKLDKSLLLNVSSDNNSHANLEKLFNLTANSQHECVVEGVETSQELEILTHIGFSKFQGYFLGRPIQFADLFVESRKLSG